MTTPKGNSMKLIVRWSRGHDPASDDPTEIHWENGQRATLADYIRHLDDTYYLTDEGGDFICIVFPDVVADVRFSKDIGRWLCQAPGQNPIIMELSDPDISDHQIIAELHTDTFVYRAVIDRGGSPDRVKEPSSNDSIPAKKEASRRGVERK